MMEPLSWTRWMWITRLLNSWFNSPNHKMMRLEMAQLVLWDWTAKKKVIECFRSPQTRLSPVVCCTWEPPFALDPPQRMTYLRTTGLKTKSFARAADDIRQVVYSALQAAIMVYCQAFGCRNRSGKCSSGKSFHPFPNPKERPEHFQKWISAVKVEKFLQKSYIWSRHDVICSDHFVETDFQEDLRSRLMETKPRIILKEEAVPSIFTHSHTLASSNSREIRSTKARDKEYLRTVLEGPVDTPRAVVASKGSLCPSTSTSLNTSLPMEGIEESDGEAPHTVTAQTDLQEPVAGPSRRKRKGKSKRKKNTSKKRHKCCDRHSFVVTANATTQTLSSGLRKKEDKMNQCPEDFSYVAMDHTYATSLLPILQPSLVMVNLQQASSNESTESDSESASTEMRSTQSQAVSTESGVPEIGHESPLHLLNVSPACELSHVPLPQNSSSSQQVPLTPVILPVHENVESSLVSPSGSSTSPSSSSSSPSRLSSSSSISSSPTSPSKSGLSSESYNPSSESDVSSSCSGDEEPAEIRHCMERKYIVFEDKLDELLYGQECKACTDGHVAELKKSMVGTMLTVNVTCVCGNIVKRWHSQPTIGRQPVGNLLTCAAVVYSGKTYEDMKAITDLLNLQYMADTTFYEIHDKILLPVIHTFYAREINQTREEHTGRALTVCGDGRCDSPGYSAKYCTYTCIDMSTHKILGMALVHVKEATSSVAMEKLGFQRTLDDLLQSALDVSVVATDRHTGIRKTLREDYANIDHQFDVWHLTKSVTKRLTAKAKQKDCQDLGPWIKSITNHVWWSAQNCGEDEVMLIEMIQSITHHVCNIHTWNSADKYHKCQHQPLTPEESARKKWITPGSESHKALQAVLFDRRLVTDMKKLTKACHTGAIEVYHSLYLKYCPKRKHFFYRAMLARAELAVLDHNANTGRKQATVKRPRRGTAGKGELRFRYVWSKATKNWIQKRIPEDKNYAYLWDMLVAVLQVKAGDFALEAPEYPALPSNIAPVPRPSREELMEQATSRFVQ